MNARIVNIETSTPAGPERTWEVLCHLPPLLGYVFPLGWIIGPLIVWLLKKAEYTSVDTHGREVMNFQISWLIYAVACIPLCFVVIGFFLLILLAVAGVVLSILGAVRASSGTLYRYPLTLRLL